METNYKINDYGLNGSYLPMMEANSINDIRKPFFGIGKRSFLIYHHNKYVTVPTLSIAFFYIKNEATVIVTFDTQEYSVNYSLEQIEHLLSEQQFYRLNRQYLLNFNTVKEVEHYFARKLLVVPTIPFQDKLIVSKDRAKHFLDWLENR